MKKSIKSISFIVLSLLLSVSVAHAQSVVEQINSYGTFDKWCSRTVPESGIIGGAEKTLYEFYGDYQSESYGSEPFVAPEGYLWRTNNVVAKIVGIVKTNVTVFPEPRGAGFCARIETHMETVKAIGIINLDVCCQGALVIGTLPEPIRDTKSPMAKVFYGVPCTARPEALVFDWKAEVGHKKVIATGLSRVKYSDDKDYPIAIVILQKRWEDEDGNVHAERVGTAVHTFRENRSTWINDYEMKIHYGDISGEPFFESSMALNNDEETAFHTLNSKGKNVMVQEEGWADADETPNHIIINFLSSSGEAFSGGVGNTLWVDNVRLVMPEE